MLGGRKTESAASALSQTARDVSDSCCAETPLAWLPPALAHSPAGAYRDTPRRPYTWSRRACVVFRPSPSASCDPSAPVTPSTSVGKRMASSGWAEPSSHTAVKARMRASCPCALSPLTCHSSRAKACNHSSQSPSLMQANAHVALMHG